MQIPSIHLKSVSKKFNKYYLYKNISLDIFPKDKISITGNNGSGKSTLLKIIIGLVTPNDGNVEYIINEKKLEKKYWHQLVSVAAPYMNISEDFTVNELIEHLSVFRKFQLSKNEMLSKLELDKHLDKPIKFFSSGMKQKTRLLLAILDCAPVLLLDEPLSNLDENNAQWYSEMIQKFAMNKTILVFSNSLEKEYFFCDKHFSLS